MLVPAVVPSVGLLVGVLTVVPESPRWLVSRGRPTDALAVLQSIRSEPGRVEHELDEVQN
jgi:major inositol transporter-like SP family MFS transporter